MFLYMHLFPLEGNVQIEGRNHFQKSRKTEFQPVREEGRAENCWPATLPLSDVQWYRDAHSPCSHSGMLCLQSAALCHYEEPGCHVEPEEKS